MTKVINLQKARKVKARADKEQKAVENRRKFGRTKQEKQAEKLRAEQAERHIKGHELEAEEE